MLTLERLQPYLLGDEESYVGDLHTTKQHLVLNLEIREEEGYGWIEGEGLLDPLIPLREAILVVLYVKVRTSLCGKSGLCSSLQVKFFT